MKKAFIKNTTRDGTYITKLDRYGTQSEMQAEHCEWHAKYSS
jgi:hypothetical protein